MTNEITVLATLENISKVTGFVDQHLIAFNCPLRTRIQLKVAVDELLGNIANYAYYPDHGHATIRVDVEKEPTRVILTFIDSGAPYDPLSREAPDISLPARQRQIGGLGIFMVRKTMDSISYEYKNGQNILTVLKNVEPSSSQTKGSDQNL